MGRDRPLDALGLAQRYGRANDQNDLLDFFATLLLGRPADEVLPKHLRAALGPKAGLSEDIARRAVVLLLASPEAQLA